MSVGRRHILSAKRKSPLAFIEASQLSQYPPLRPFRSYRAVQGSGMNLRPIPSLPATTKHQNLTLIARGLLPISPAKGKSAGYFRL
jgi:hypothetical protein